jgi:hypothetical protein
MTLVSVLRFWICNKANCKMDWITEQDGNRENKGKEFAIFVYLVGTYVCSYTTDGMYVSDRDYQETMAGLDTHDKMTPEHSSYESDFCYHLPSLLMPS